MESSPSAAPADRISHASRHQAGTHHPQFDLTVDSSQPRSPGDSVNSGEPSTSGRLPGHPAATALSQQLAAVTAAVQSSSSQMPVELRRVMDRVLTAVLRGAGAAMLIKGGLHALTFTIYYLSKLRGKGRAARKRTVSLAEAAHDTVVYAVFFAGLGGSYTAVDEGLALLFGKERTQRWRALVAGIVAGQALRITGSQQRHYSLATYVLLRGLTLLIRTGNKTTAPPALRALLSPTRLAHGDTLLMCLSASQIIYSFVMEPSTLPHTYVRFIMRQGGKEPYVWEAIREHALRNSSGLAPGPLRALAGTPLQHLNQPGCLARTPCQVFHAGQTCSQHVATMVPQAYVSALSVYVPFYLVSSVLVHRTALLARPGAILPKVAAGIGRSAAFLSLYIAVAFAGACAGFHSAGVNTGAVVAGSVWTGGLATLVEKKSRRMELALYCTARAMEAGARCWSKWGWVAAQQLPARTDVLLFSLGCGAIMHCYSDCCGRHRDVFRSKYLNVLDFVFGSSGVQEGSIKHVPTNRDLLNAMGRRIKSSLSTSRLHEALHGSYTHGHGHGARGHGQRAMPERLAFHSMSLQQVPMLDRSSSHGDAGGRMHRSSLSMGDDASSAGGASGSMGGSGLLLGDALGSSQLALTAHQPLQEEEEAEGAGSGEETEEAEYPPAAAEGGRGLVAGMDAAMAGERGSVAAQAAGGQGAGAVEGLRGQLVDSPSASSLAEVGATAAPEGSGAAGGRRAGKGPRSGGRQAHGWLTRLMGRAPAQQLQQPAADAGAAGSSAAAPARRQLGELQQTRSAGAAAASAAAPVPFTTMRMASSSLRRNMSEPGLSLLQASAVASERRVHGCGSYQQLKLALLQEEQGWEAVGTSEGDTDTDGWQATGGSGSSGSSPNETRTPSAALPGAAPGGAAGGGRCGGARRSSLDLMPRQQVQVQLRAAAGCHTSPVPSAACWPRMSPRGSLELTQEAVRMVRVGVEACGEPSASQLPLELAVDVAPSGSAAPPAL